MKKLVISSVVGLVAAMVAGGAYGAITLYTGNPTQIEDWDVSGDGMREWENDGNFIPSIPVAVGNSMAGDYAVEINFDSQGFGPPIPEYRRVYADDNASNAQGRDFAGNNDYYVPGDGTYSANFQFYANDYVPFSLELYFYSATSGREWRRVLDNPSLNVWTAYTVALEFDAFWTGGSGYGEFVADLADIDRIGIWVYRNTSLDAQLYGFDDFFITFTIPEPQTYMMLGVVLLSLGIVFRKRITESVDSVLSRARS